MFPENKVNLTMSRFKDNNDSIKGNNNMKEYQSSDECENDVQCSTCLEDFEPGAVVVSSACSHAYHRGCAMEWIHKKDECPNCRQPIWDPEVYSVTKRAILLRRVDSDDDITV